MAKKRREISEKIKNQEDLRKRQHKLDSIKTDFEAGKIISFEQIFAVMAESRFATELRMGFITFRNKVNSPGDFTLNELIRFAELVGIDVQMVLKFIFGQINKTKVQAKRNS
ncbi:hypothetical protein [Ferruginibacter sp.]